MHMNLAHCNVLYLLYIEIERNYLSRFLHKKKLVKVYFYFRINPVTFFNHDYIFLLPESLRFSVKPTCSTIIMTTKITPIVQRTLTIRRHLRKLSHFKHVTCRAKTLLFSDFMAGDILFKKLQRHKNGTFCQ